MWEIEASTDIAVPVETVYRYLANFPRHAEWSLGVAAIEPATQGAIGVGTEYRATEIVPRRFTSFSRITALEPPRRIGWESWDGRVMRVHWTFELSPTEGGTRLLQRCRWVPTNLLGTFILNLIRKRQVPKENAQSLERIKARLEAMPVLEGAA